MSASAVDRGEDRGSGTQVAGPAAARAVPVAGVSPVLTYLVALVVVVLRVRARRRTWWVPVLALVVGAGLWVLGGVIAALGAS